MESLGYSVQIINYRPDYLVTKKPKLYLNVFKPISFFVRLIKYRSLKENFAKFRECEKRLHLTEEVKSTDDIERVCRDFDYVVFGSDQIWSRTQTKGDRIWFGKFETGTALKITYAASAGDLSFNDEDISNFATLIGNFSYISVREKQLSDFIYKVAGKRVPCVLDPTFIMPRDFWSQWFRPIRDDRYILIRQARISTDARRVVNELSRQLKCKVVSVDSTNWMLWGAAEQHIYTPFEFISLVKNAECVVTTSFHGLAFSIICNTPFYALKLNDGQDGRCEGLLNQVGLSHRIIRKGDPVKFEPIDFGNTNNRLFQLRIESQSYLKDALTL